METTEKDATLLCDTLQDLLMILTDGYNTYPFPEGTEKANALNDALAVIHDNVSFEETSEQDATLMSDTLQDLLITLTDGYNTYPFPEGTEKANAIDDALAVMREYIETSKVRRPEAES